MTSMYLHMNMISILVIPSISTASVTDFYFKATALFCTDNQGNILFFTGPLPSTVEDIIKSDMQSRIDPKAIVKIVPIIENITRLPFSDSQDVLPEILSYSDILKADLFTVKSRKNIIKNLWDYIFNSNANENHVPPPSSSSPSSSPSSSSSSNKKKPPPSAWNEKSNTNQTEETTEAFKTKQGSSQEDYIINDIYYAIEKKCVNWADNCNDNLSVLDMPSKYFNIRIPLGHREPKLKINWTP